MRKRFAIAVIWIPWSPSTFIRNPLEVRFLHTKSPFLNPTHNVRLKDFIKLYKEAYILCVCPCFEPSGLNIFCRGREDPFSGGACALSPSTMLQINRTCSVWYNHLGSDLTLNKGICLKYDLSKTLHDLRREVLVNIRAAEGDTTPAQLQLWPLTPPALDSVYKVPTLLISAPITPEL